ncbi:TrmH family RNA methyltransferase [Roseateles saccharophilus]|uniref:TrmH family RNA methyltransferase n=1 Tax=Roseateles saccharophilus TaxID=304 RepID=A0A4R3UIU7_ROSSA|nr:RNA methyltransferase [Roseateles saccharophilus]MDG0833838.1 RNA methyltransferase [Roseateles saccharophilus]TCU91536.1 TrmH family RNA methyltransferase [Roseateles saccharophilus]
MKIDTITSRDNPALVRLRKLGSEPGGYRKTGSVWIEGDHLLRAALQRGWTPVLVVATEAAMQDAVLRALAEQAPRVLVVPTALFKALSGLESPAQIGAELTLPAASAIDANAASVVLDRLQDAGNVGAILRSAAAFGVRQVLALKGTAALWSPKVVRAGQGAHFGLRLIEGLAADDLAALAVPLIATSSHTEHVLNRIALPSPCAWVMGHEGQGVSPELMARCALTVGIPQPGGEESLNVAAAAAICLYESQRQKA